MAQITFNLRKVDAIKLIRQYQNSKLKYYPIEEDVPINRLISKQQQKEIIDAITKHEPRVSVNEVDITFEENGISLNISYIIRNINRAGSISTSLTRAA